MFNMNHDDTLKFMIEREIQTHDVVWDMQFERDHEIVVRLLRQIETRKRS